MTGFRSGCTALLALGFAAACAKDSPSSEIAAPEAAVDAAASGGSSSGGSSDGFSGDGHVAMRDDCDPDDPAWGPTGGCLLKRGSVTFAEFVQENLSPLALAVVGHQAWRNDPSYLKIHTRATVRVRNEGGRVHTFTKVTRFGGGKVPAPFLTLGLTPAPECPASKDIPPGGGERISGLGPGNHRFQCCIHPWMRTVIKVKAN